MGDGWPPLLVVSGGFPNNLTANNQLQTEYLMSDSPPPSQSEIPLQP